MTTVSNASAGIEAQVAELGQVRSMEYELGVLRYVLRRLMETDEAGFDRQMVQNLTSVVTGIVRAMQLQTRLIDPMSKFQEELDYAFEMRGLVPGATPAPMPAPMPYEDDDPTPAGW